MDRVLALDGETSPISGTWPRSSRRHFVTSSNPSSDSDSDEEVGKRSALGSHLGSEHNFSDGDLDHVESGKDGASRELLQACALSMPKGALGRPLMTQKRTKMADNDNLLSVMYGSTQSGKELTVRRTKSILFGGREDYSTSSSMEAPPVEKKVHDPIAFAYRRKSMLSYSHHRSLSRPFKRSVSRKMTLFALSMVNLTAYLTMSIIAPFFPYEASLKGMTSAYAGFVFSVYALVMMVASPILGSVLPLVGIKFMLLAGIWFNGWANILFGVLVYIDDTTTFTWMCFLVRGVAAFGAACFSTASYTYIIQLFPENVGLAFGLTETCVGIGMSMGPAVGGLLYGLGGYQLPFYILGTFVLLNIFTCYYYVKPLEGSHLKRPDTSAGRHFGYSTLAKNPRVVVVSIVLAVATSTQGFLDPTVEPHFRDYGISPEYVGLIFLVMSAAYALSSPVGGWLANNMEDKSPLMVVGLLGTVVGYLLLGPSDLLGLERSMYISTAAMMVLGLAYSLSFVPTFEAILDLVITDGASDDIETYGLVSGWWSACNNLGELVGAGVGGLLFQNFGFIQSTNIVAFYTLGTAILLTFTYLTSLVTRAGAGCAGHVSIKDPEKLPLLLTHSNNHAGPEYYATRRSCDICDDSDITTLGRLKQYRQYRQLSWRKDFTVTS
ncbi:MFS-type transporter SLC18B1 [Halotydeus destructor]|nr:MFS-type transporter SLC18B1 [Halotydeus destructor]